MYEKLYIRFEEWNKESLDIACKEAERLWYVRYYGVDSLKLRWNWVLRLDSSWVYYTSRYPARQIAGAKEHKIQIENKVERAYGNVKMQWVLENCTWISNTKVSLIPHKINWWNLWVDPGSYDSHLIYNGEDYWIWNKLKGLQPLANDYFNWYFQWNIGNTIWITSNSIVSWNNTWETHIEEETYKPKRLYEIL